MQPIYEKSVFKINARQENIKLFREITGRQCIPKGRTYWTLCNRQTVSPGSEISQLLDAGLLTTGQFHGVDRDEDIIERNKQWHPKAHWHHGDWIEFIESCGNKFNPAFIYLDTTSFADHYPAENMTARTMLLCPRNTLLLVNVMLNDPRSSRQFDINKLIDKINCKIPPMELQNWDRSVKNYSYSATGKTTMNTYVLYKR